MAVTLDIGDMICLADGSQLVGFARVVKLTPKTAVADALEKQGITPPTTSGVPGADNYIPGAAMGFHVVLLADGTVRCSASARRTFTHKMTWIRYPGVPVPRLLNLM